jgi:predicted outer membrane repeat protein
MLDRRLAGELKPLTAAMVMGLGLSLGPNVYAATFTVTTTSDSGAGSLRDAITQSNTVCGTNTVNFNLPTPSTITLTTQIIIDCNVTINGPGSGNLGIVAGGTQRIFYVSDSNPTVTIAGVTLSRTSGQTTSSGGAIYNYGGTVTIQNSVITGHSSTNRGGAIYNYFGVVNITNSTISNNTSTNAGGAIFNYSGTVSVSGSAVTGNKTTNAGGGSIFIHSGSVTLTNSTFSGNQSAFGGGVLYANGSAYYYYAGAVKGTAHHSARAKHAHASNIAKAPVSASAQLAIHKAKRAAKGKAGKTRSKSTHAKNHAIVAAASGHVAAGTHVRAASINATVTISGSTFSTNTASTVGGQSDGGVLYLHYANVNIDTSTFSGNSTKDDGGAIYHRAGAMNISNSTFSSNTASFGGAISRFNYYEGNSTTITNSTFSGNTATTTGNEGGGALFFYNQPVLIRNSTFSGNTAAAGAGGAINLYGATLTLQSTILANSTDSTGNRDIILRGSDGGAGSIAADHSLIVNGGGFVPADPTNVLGQNPLLAALANNGGPTQTHLLQTGSPAIDKGSNPAGLAFDQRGAGFPRVNGAQADIGAVEGVGAPPPPPGQPVNVPTLSQWGAAMLSVLLGAGALIGGRRRREPNKNA